MTKADPLLLALQNCETRLSKWVHGSETNARLFASDPVAALRAAGLGLEETLLSELESVMTGIADKLNVV